MGNSEVGHNALGAGRIFEQGAKLVDAAIASGRLFEGAVWRELIAHCIEQRGALHLLGLLSDGNVHSHEHQLHALIKQVAVAGVRKLFVHVLTDGRDVPGDSALIYVDRLESVLAEINTQNSGFCYRIASGGGRMLVTMDRYEADWSIVQRGWQTHVAGDGRQFTSAREAIETLRTETGVNDQFLPPFVIAEHGKPIGAMSDGDSVVFFNFRGDRAIEISRAFEDEQFPYFEREPRPRVKYAGMMQYDGDLHIPKRFLVDPPAINRTVSEYLVHQGVRQFAISETQKYGHITYFWNGNRSGKFDPKLEDYVEIPSDLGNFDHRPWMKAAEITNATLDALSSQRYDFLRLNLANGDMVGHTGDIAASIIAVATVDLCLKRLLHAINKLGGIALITADHGNSDDMFQLTKSGTISRDQHGQPIPKTSHSLNPVPFAVYNPRNLLSLQPAHIQQPGLGNVASTILTLLGFAPPEDYNQSLVDVSLSS
jgi:2,3-bisphosphoglycerate-independent phosphoglycerate mutase